VSITTDQRRLAVARCVFEAQKAASIFRVNDDWVPSRAVEQAIKQAEHAFADDDYDRAEHLAKVVLCMVRRDAPKFQADPKAWVALKRSVQ
jgi:hypothetical protein